MDIGKILGGIVDTITGQQQTSAPKTSAPKTSALEPNALTPEQLRHHQKLVKATQGFEAMFIGSLLKQMRKSIAGDTPLFGSSQEAKMYQEMMDDATAQQMSRTGSLGFANMLVKTLEHKSSPAPVGPHTKQEGPHGAT